MSAKFSPLNAAVDAALELVLFRAEVFRGLDALAALASEVL